MHASRLSSEPRVGSLGAGNLEYRNSLFLQPSKVSRGNDGVGGRWITLDHHGLADVQVTTASGTPPTAREE
jgi:hypothetical protein